MVYAKHPICDTKTGSGCCSKDARKTDLGVYGVGMVLYFQFLKSVTWMFFIASIFSAPAYMFYYSGNTSNGQSNLKSELTSFTLGNIGQCKLILPYRF
jgi:hypothetical protein